MSSSPSQPHDAVIIHPTSDSLTKTFTLGPVALQLVSASEAKPP
jgi:hypothetical protein